MTNIFRQQETDKLKFILCPHLEETGEYALGVRFVHLVDGPEATRTLVLCGVCANVVVGKFAAEIVEQITANAQIEVARTVTKHYEVVTPRQGGSS